MRSLTKAIMTRRTRLLNSLPGFTDPPGDVARKPILSLGCEHADNAQQESEGVDDA
jgi:hypothetical protein